MRVITYGTFDLFHEGHRRLLERAKELGDELIVGVTTENFDEARGKLNVRQPLMDRIKNVEASGLADRVIIEEYEEQKVHAIQRYGVDVFAVGSDWLGAFDYLSDYCNVIYLERTQGVSSTDRTVLSLTGLKMLGGSPQTVGIVGASRLTREQCLSLSAAPRRRKLDRMRVGTSALTNNGENRPRGHSKARPAQEVWPTLQEWAPPPTAAVVPLTRGGRLPARAQDPGGEETMTLELQANRISSSDADALVLDRYRLDSLVKLRYATLDAARHPDDPAREVWARVRPLLDGC